MWFRLLQNAKTKYFKVTGFANYTRNHNHHQIQLNLNFEIDFIPNHLHAK
jgi:hypothetical protein